MTIASGGEVLVRSLADHGVDTVFGIPGTHNLDIYAHLPSHGLRHISPRHEQGAGYAADGYARASGRVGVSLSTSGPALLNAATAAAQSYSDSVPVLHVSPGMPTSHPGRGDGSLHEVKDQSRAMDAIVAYSHRVASVEAIPEAVAEAFAAMTFRRPRPVHLEVPFDLLRARAAAPRIGPLVAPPAIASDEALDAAAAQLSGASRPGVVVGGGARAATSQVAAIAERLGAPVVATANGKGVLPEDHPFSLGAGLHHRSVADFVADCDVVVAVGTELAPSDLWAGPLPTDGKLVRIDIDAEQVLRNGAAAVGLVGDAALTLTALLERLGGADPDPDARERATRWRDRHAADAAAEGAPWLELLTSIGSVLGRGGIVAGDSAMVCYYGALSNLPRYRPASFLYPTGLGTLGYGLPAAIGAKVARPGERVMALLGDGGVMFTVAELAAAAQLGLPLPIVVVDNGGYGEIRREMLERGQEPVGTLLPRVDLPATARSFGCHGVEVEDPSDLAEPLEQAFEADRPTLLRLPEVPASAVHPTIG
jgi:thiamine pyrophosphate-dependent acetolactate synthase large subunit-like protein